VALLSSVFSIFGFFFFFLFCISLPTKRANCVIFIVSF
jgi:hypothetical protein